MGSIRALARAGFTLVEVLVTLILLAILAAVLFPVVTQQLDEGDPTRAANDLANVRTGIETFNLNVRPTFPGDMEDLVFEVTTNDDQVNGDPYTNGHINRWNGPYVDGSITEGDVITGAFRETGFGGIIQTDLVCYNATNNTDEGATCTQGTHFVTVKVEGLDDAQFQAMNSLIDGDIETQSTDEGKLRGTDASADDGALDTGGTVYYLAVPYRGN